MKKFLLTALIALPLASFADPLPPDSTAAMGQKFVEPAKQLRVLLVGSGTSHDFPKFFLGTDAQTLKSTGKMDIAATPNLEEALTLISQADVLVFSGNHDQYGKPPFQKALNEFADSGKGIVLLHAATWSHRWPGYNDRFVAGRTPSHGKGEFEVTIKDAAHAVTKEVPGTFKIFDENYRTKISDETKVHICAHNAPDGSAEPNPSVWTVNDSKTKIVCITLGHDGQAHDHPAFKSLLINAVNWVSKR